MMYYVNCIYKYFVIILCFFEQDRILGLDFLRFIRFYSIFLIVTFYRRVNRGTELQGCSGLGDRGSFGGVDYLLFILGRFLRVYAVILFRGKSNFLKFFIEEILKSKFQKDQIDLRY